MKQMRNLLMAHRHVPSRQELPPISAAEYSPRRLTGLEKFSHAASMDHAGSASVFRSPKASALQFRGSKQRTARLLPALAIRGTARQGKHMYPLSAPSPSARRQMLCSRAPPAISNTSRPVERLLAPVPVPSLSSPIDPPVLHASPLSGKGAPRFNSFLSERASDRFKEAAA